MSASVAQFIWANVIKPSSIPFGALQEGDKFIWAEDDTAIKTVCRRGWYWSDVMNRKYRLRKGVAVIEYKGGIQ